MNRVISLALTCVLLLGTSGCATMHDTFGDAAPIVCGVLGAAAGAGIGAVASNWHDDEDHRNDQKAGYAIGAGAGAVVGATLCALGGEEAVRNPPTVRATAMTSRSWRFSTSVTT